MEVYFGNLTSERGHLDKLAAEMESLVEDAEELVNTTGGHLPEPERQRLAELLGQLKSSASHLKVQALEGCRITDKAIREHPYRSAGVALMVGLLVGVLAGRPSRDD